MDYRIKAFQVASFFMAEHNYQRVMINGLVNNDIFILFNKNHSVYPLICIFAVSPTDEDKNQIEDIQDIFTKRSFKEIKRLSVFIGKSNMDESFLKDTIYLDTGYYAGKDYSDLYPGIKNIIHETGNEQEEIQTLEKRVSNAYFSNMKKRLSLFSKNHIVTIIFCILCILNYIGRIFITSKGYSETCAEVMLGADYRTFTYGLNQFYRLLTYAFVHGSFTHLFCNIYSLIMLGRYMEEKYGSIRYLLILIFSILAGSLTYGLFNTNGIIVGLSGGLYGLLSLYVMEMILDRPVINRMFFYVLFLNIIMNFLPNVGWQVHLGGFMCGLIFYFLFREKKFNYSNLALLLAMFLILGYKYADNNSINPFYSGTDFEIVDCQKELTNEDYASKTYIKLINLYQKGGQ